MTFAIIESEVEIPYRFNNTYYPHKSEFRHVGNKQLGFTDADIVEIINHVKSPLRGELKFYKERLYPKPDVIVFTIYDVHYNIVITELHVVLSERRSYWRKCRPGWTFPDMSVRLKLTQDPNKRPITWTGHYT